MSRKLIEVLNRKIEKLSEPDFDLDAWKASVIAALLSAFPQDDHRIALVDGLKVDYSSWALRDATSTYNPRESVKKQGKEVLTSIIETLEISQAKLPNEIQELIDSQKWDELSQRLKKEKKENLVSLILEMVK